MAKRFTDTGKWKKPFLRGLDGAYKLLWIYVCDDCDHAGIWQVDFDIAKICIGEKVNQSEALKKFAGRIIPFDGGSKWFLPSFIEFQYPGGLNEKNKVHNSVINTLSKYDLIDENFKPHPSPMEAPCNGAKDMDKDKEKEKDKEKDSEKQKVVFPWDSATFLLSWKHWKEYKQTEHRFNYKSEISEQAALKELAELSEGFEENAIKIINHSISKGWKGFFKLKDEDYAKRVIKTTKEQQSDIDEAASRYFRD